MANPVAPTIKVRITPKFKSTSEIECLGVTLTIESPNLRAGSAVVSFPSRLKKVTSIRHQDGMLQASDELGKLSTIYKGDSGIAAQRWEVERDTSGSIVIAYNKFPSVKDKSISGSSIDLRYDHGGLLGPGLSFIPIPPRDVTYSCTVEWDLSAAPKGTRAVWTFGEGPEPITKTGPSSLLSDSVYMVGPIQSNPPALVPGSISDYYGYYWFGALPPNVEVIRDIHHAFFLKVSSFFGDTPSAINPYRSFVRSTTPEASFGGTNFIRSHIFDYDDRISIAVDYDLIRRMAYEMVHNFLGPSITDSNIDWLFEGIKNTLSIYLPFRPPNQFRTGHYFQSTLSMLCMKYYTNPLLHVPHNEVLVLASDGNAYAKDMLAARAWAFVIGTDFAARKLVEITKPPQRPIEDLAFKPLAKKRANGESHGIEEWVQLLTPLMSDDAKNLYEEMCEGKVIILPVEVFGAKTHCLRQVDQEILDFGMERESFEEGMVKGLKIGSRAEKAGLRDGDKIVSNSYIWKCVDDFDAQMDVVVQRKEKIVTVKYWPRSFEKAKSWQMVEVEQT